VAIVGQQNSKKRNKGCGRFVFASFVGATLSLAAFMTKKTELEFSKLLRTSLIFIYLGIA
jgi:hypothetical protein